MDLFLQYGIKLIEVPSYGSMDHSSPSDDFFNLFGVFLSPSLLSLNRED